MNLEDLRSFKDWLKDNKAVKLLSRTIEPVGTELDVLKDVYAEVRTLRLREREVEIPGIKRAWDEGIILGAVAAFKDRVKRDIMPIQFAKDDNLVIEPLYRPAIFNMTSFSVSWTGATPPAKIDLLTPGGSPGAYDLAENKELIILTDIICLDATPAVTEIQITVDGEEQRPLSCRKDFLASDLHIYDLPFPVVADINLRIQGRVETASGTFNYLPIGLHAVLGSLHKKTLV